MKKLKEIRENAGLTQKQLASLIGISKSRYGHYEIGRRKLPIEIAKDIGKALDINWWELYEDG
ncbi:MAG: helix-turn-helix transcriptional regulator [Peptoniphilus harei]|nr:helix-turn-helix transcriptional regulator [Peptoniphilus harei]